ncbi:unnamed protein product, partial [Ceratitis capitata]
FFSTIGNCNRNKFIRTRTFVFRLPAASDPCSARHSERACDRNLILNVSSNFDWRLYVASEGKRSG